MMYIDSHVHIGDVKAVEFCIATSKYKKLKF